MSNKLNLLQHGAILAVCITLASCGGGSSNGSGDTVAPPTTTAPPPAAVATLSGTVVAGPTKGASVTLYDADASGKATGTVLGTTTSDASGNYVLTLTALPKGAVVVTASGGEYVSEADGSTQKGLTLNALLPAVVGGANTAVISPLSHFETAFAQNAAPTGAGGDVKTALAAAHASITALFGASALTDPASSVKPNFTATSGQAYVLAVLLGTFEQLRKNTAFTGADLYQALADDIADGKLDGLKNGVVVNIGTSGKPVLPSLFTTQLSGAANDYAIANPAALTQTMLTSAAAQKNGAQIGNVIGSSGAIAPLQNASATTGTNAVYFAARRDGLISLDMSNPAAPVATRMSAINAAVMPSIFTSIDGVIVAGTQIQSKSYAVLYSYASSAIVSVNLTDGKVVGKLDLKVARTSFSGASAFIAGGIADGARSLVWLATGSGLVGINPADLTIAPISIAQPSGTQISENIGGDPSLNLIFSPDYANNNLVVFDLQQKKAYVSTNADWKAISPSFSELDGVALDAGYGVAIANPEGSNVVSLIKYDALTASNSSTGIYTPKKFTSFTTKNYYAGAAVDSKSHYVLMVGEGSSIGIGQLDDPTLPGWKGFASFVDATTAYRFEPHDPHAVGAFNIGGKSHGFLLNQSKVTGSSYEILVLDLAGLLASPASAGRLNTDPLAGTFVKHVSY